MVGGEGPPADENYMICYLQVEEIEKFIMFWKGQVVLIEMGKQLFSV